MPANVREMIILAVLAIAGIVIAEYMGGPRWRKALTAGVLVALLVTGWKIYTGEIVF